MGSRAEDVPLPNGGGTDYTKTDYPCDSRIVRAVSAGSDPAGPYKLAEVIGLTDSKKLSNLVSSSEAKI